MKVERGRTPRTHIECSRHRPVNIGSLINTTPVHTSFIPILLSSPHPSISDFSFVSFVVFFFICYCHDDGVNETGVMASQASPASGVQNLRARFESGGGGASPSPLGPRSRKSSGAHSNESSPSQSRATIRSNVVAVTSTQPQSLPKRDGPPPSPPPPPPLLPPAGETESTASRRRGSFSVSDSTDPAVLAELKQTIGQELEKRRRKSSVMEMVPEVAVLTPAIGHEGLQLGEQQPREGMTSDNVDDDEKGYNKESVKHEVDGLATLDSDKRPDVPLNTEKRTDEVNASSSGQAAAQISPVDSASPSGSTAAALTTSASADPLPTSTSVDAHSNDQNANSVSRLEKGAPTGETTSRGRRPRPETKKQLPRLSGAAKAASTSDAPNGTTRPADARPSSTTTKTGSAKAAVTRSPALGRTQSHSQKGDQRSKPSSRPAQPSKPEPTHADHVIKDASGTNAPAGSAASAQPAGATHGREHASSANKSARPRSMIFAPTASSAARSATTNTTTTAAAGGTLARTSSDAGTRNGPHRQRSGRKMTKPVVSKSTATSSHDHHEPNNGRAHGHGDEKYGLKEAPTLRPATKPAHEGFLARMMRPTASSAKKTHERPTILSRSSSTLHPKGTSAGSAAPRKSNDGTDADVVEGSRTGSVPEPEPEPEHGAGMEGKVAPSPESPRETEASTLK